MAANLPVEANSTATAKVPEQMHLTNTMKATKIDTVKLTSLTFNNQAVTVSDVSTVGKAVKSHTGEHGSICFVVRRPGCQLCREEGKDLKELLSNDDSPLMGFDLFGVVKEIGIDDKGLAEFQSKYYPYDLYRDDDLVLYNKFIGKRKKSSSTWNPLRGLRSKSKQKKDNSIDEMKGGLILFDKNGEVRYVYQENTGKQLAVDDIAAAALAIKEGEK